MKAITLLATACLATCALSQTKPTPCIITFGDTLSDVGYDFEYMLGAKETPKTKPYVPKGCVKITASQNGQSLRLFAQATQGKGEPKAVTVHQLHPSQAMGMIGFEMSSFYALELPALDVKAIEPAYMELELNMPATGPTFLGFAATSKEEKAQLKVQKQWTPSNFKVQIDGMPTATVTEVSAFEVVEGGDLDGDGVSDYSCPDPIELTMSVEDLPAYLGWLGSPDPAAPDHNFEVRYNDVLGNPILSVTTQVDILSWGYDDPFSGDGPYTGRKVRVLLQPVATTRVDSWAAVIE